MPFSNVPSGNIADMRIMNAVVERKGKIGMLYINGPIVTSDFFKDFFGEDIGVKASMKDVLKEIDDLKDCDEIVMRINSPGGEVAAAYNIASRLKALGKPITTVNDGLAASAAAFLFNMGDRRINHSYSVVMIHEPWISTEVSGNAKAFKAVYDYLQAFTKSVALSYVARTAYTLDEVYSMMAETKWITSDEALEEGFSDETVDSFGDDGERRQMMKKDNPEDGEDIKCSTFTHFSVAASIGEGVVVPENLMNKIRSMRPEVAEVISTWYSKSNGAKNATQNVSHETLGGSDKSMELKEILALYGLSFNSESELTAKLEAAKSKDSELKAKVGELTVQNTSLSSDLTSALSSVDALTATNAELSKSNEELSSKIGEASIAMEMMSTMKASLIEGIKSSLVQLDGNSALIDNSFVNDYLQAMDLKTLQSKAEELGTKVTSKFAGAGHGTPVASVVADDVELQNPGNDTGSVTNPVAQGNLSLADVAEIENANMDAKIQSYMKQNPTASYMDAFNAVK